jgi:hypothetical protein
MGAINGMSADGQPCPGEQVEVDWLAFAIASCYRNAERLSYRAQRLQRRLEGSQLLLPHTELRRMGCTAPACT